VTKAIAGLVNLCSWSSSTCVPRVELVTVVLKPRARRRLDGLDDFEMGPEDGFLSAPRLLASTEELDLIYKISIPKGESTVNDTSPTTVIGNVTNTNFENMGKLLLAALPKSYQGTVNVTAMKAPVVGEPLITTVTTTTTTPGATTTPKGLEMDKNFAGWAMVIALFVTMTFIGITVLTCCCLRERDLDDEEEKETKRSKKKKAKLIRQPSALEQTQSRASLGRQGSSLAETSESGETPDSSGKAFPTEPGVGARGSTTESLKGGVLGSGQRSPVVSPAAVAFTMPGEGQLVDLDDMISARQDAEEAQLRHPGGPHARELTGHSLSAVSMGSNMLSVSTATPGAASAMPVTPRGHSKLRGLWIDEKGKFYGGARILFSETGWKPLNPPLQEQRDAVYTMQMQYGHPELVETRSDGVKRVYSMNLRKDGKCRIAYGQGKRALEFVLSRLGD